MLDNNTNKVTWVALAVGIVAVLGIGSMALFPEANTALASNVSRVVQKFTSVKLSKPQFQEVNPDARDSTINIQYSQLPDGSYFSGNNYSDNGQMYSVSDTLENTDFSKWYSKYAQTLDGGSVTLLNGMTAYFVDAPYIDSVSKSNFDTESFLNTASGRNLFEPNNLSKNVVDVNGNISNYDFVTHQPFDAQTLDTIVTSPFAYGKDKPQDFDINLSQLSQFDDSENNKKIFNEAFPDKPFTGSDMTHISSLKIHVHFYILP